MFYFMTIDDHIVADAFLWSDPSTGDWLPLLLDWWAPEWIVNVWESASRTNLPD